MLLLCLTVAYAMLASALATATVNDEIHVSIAENNEAAGAALAQDSDRAAAPSQISSAEIGEIVVTATKRSQSINSVGMTITAATGDTLVERGITSAAD